MDSVDWKENFKKGGQRNWLVTGCAGFIGSHLAGFLLSHGQKVTGIDNFSTGKKGNLKFDVEKLTTEQLANFTFLEGDICDPDFCSRVSHGVDYILHQAALGSVPRSIEKPGDTHNSNVNGFLNILESAKANGVKRLVYASSSSVYGDSKSLPKKESVIGTPMSPYALSKLVNEQYAEVWARVYGLNSVGLRYFNVFGERQDPDGAYAAVIPRWIKLLINKSTPEIYGDGKTNRDFCYVANVVQANILAAISELEGARIYNVSYGVQTSLVELYNILVKLLSEMGYDKLPKSPLFKDFRQGDIRESLANLDCIQNDLSYKPEYSLQTGLEQALSWYLSNSC